MEAKFVTVAVEEMFNFVMRCAQRVGAKKSHAECLAELLVAADTRGHFSHGLNRLGEFDLRLLLLSLLELYYYFYGYYYYYYYYLLIRVFHISVSWRSFTGVWVIASLLKSPGLFSVFWPFSVILLFGWSPLVRQLS